MSKNKPAPDAGGPRGKLARLARRAALALSVEQMWPRGVILAGIVGVFLAVSWLGLWLDLPLSGRIVGTALFAVAIVAAVVWLAMTRRPTREDILQRLDNDAGVPHRPATALVDQLANASRDPATQALWNLHRRRLEAAVDKLKVGAPAPRMERRDRFALRAAVLLAVVAAAFVAGPEKYARVAAAFDWRGEPAAARSYRIDAWIDPPPYTGRPPSILPVKLQSADAGAAPSLPPVKIQAPVGSTVVVRLSAGLEVTPVTSQKLVPAPVAKRPAVAAKASADASDTAAQDREFRWLLKGDATLTFTRGNARFSAYELVAIADQPPTIAVTDAPVGNARGSLTVAYRTNDDYGVTSAEALFAKPLRRDEGAAARSLFPPPKAALTLPAGSNGIGDGRTVIDLSEHPWAGATVTMTLVAHDDGGNVGESAPVQVTLPQRPFLKPLARALVEQRRDLVLAPDERAHVAAALDALMIAPEDFTPEASVYLGLRSVWGRLNNAKTDDDLRGVADALWEMALQLEDGQLSDAERQLRAAEQQLRAAMQRGASEAEIKKLTEDMRAALNRFLSEMAQKAQKDKKNADKSDKPSRTITPKDLKAMMDRMEDAAKKGDMADAQKMLDQLQSVLENLKTARGRGDNDDPSAKEMSKSLNELDEMTRQQQQLRDKTFREGQKRRDADRNQSGSQEQPGATGEPDNEQAENGESGEKGENRQGAKPSDQELQDRQNGLQKQLGELEKRLKENGIAGEKGLQEAEEAMKDAGRMMSQGRDGKAVGAQGRALEGMRRGAQGLAKKMEEGNGQAKGEGEGNGTANGKQRGGRDPLDRPSNDEADAMRGGRLSGGPGAAERAQQVLQELRRRLGDPQRPAVELDYLERLLRRY